MEIEGGLAYLEMLNNGVSEETARAIATGVGVVNAGLEFLQLDELVKAYKVLDKTGADDSFFKLVLRELAKRGVDVAKETGQEVLQEGVTTAGAQLGSKLDTGEWAYNTREVLNRLWNTATESTLTFGLTNGLSAGHNVNVQNQNRLVAAGEARLRAGEMPTPEQLKALHLSEAEARGALVMLSLDQVDGAGKTAASADTTDFLAVDARDNLTSIDQRNTIKTNGGFACFPDGDPLNNHVKNVVVDEMYFDVAMHGSPTAVCFGTTETNMSPRLLASVIRHREGYTGQNIRLLSCSTGKSIDGSYCFAEELANALGVEVSAPNDVLYISRSGKMAIGDDGNGQFVTFKPNQRRRFK